MNINKRYRFWRIFWVVLALNIFFALLGIITLSVTPGMSKELNLEKFMGWRMLFTKCLELVLAAIFFYYSLNGFYRLYAERRKAVEFLKPTLLYFLSICVYLMMNSMP